MQDEAESEEEDDASETIEITHTDEGTSILIEDVTTLEFLALLTISVTVLTLVAWRWTKFRERRAGQHYSLDPKRDRGDRRLP